MSSASEFEFLSHHRQSALKDFLLHSNSGMQHARAMRDSPRMTIWWKSTAFSFFFLKFPSNHRLYQPQKIPIPALPKYSRPIEPRVLGSILSIGIDPNLLRSCSNRRALMPEDIRRACSGSDSVTFRIDFGSHRIPLPPDETYPFEAASNRGS